MARRPTRYPAGIAPTDAGRALIVGGCGGVAAAYTLGYPELAVVAVAGLLVFAGGLCTVLVRPPARADLALDRTRVPRGLHAVAVLTVSGDRTSTRWPALVRRPQVRPGFVVDLPAGSRSVTGYVDPAPTGTAVDVTIPLPTDERGIHTIGPAAASVDDPFGAVRRRTALTGTRTLIVHPAVHPARPAPSRRVVSQTDAEGSRVAAGGLVFSSVREYARDDRRQVHWRLSAHAGQLMVQQGTVPSEPTTSLVLDTRADSYPSAERAAAFEAAVDTAASLVVASAEDRTAIRLRTTSGDRFDLERGRTDPTEALDLLAAVRPDQLGGAQSAFDALAGAGRRSSTVVVVTGTQNTRVLAELLELGQRFETAVLLRLGAAAPTARPAGRAIVLEGRDALAVLRAWDRIVVHGAGHAR